MRLNEYVEAIERKYKLDEGLFGDYKDYDGWTKEDIELHDNIDWPSRNYFDYPVDGDSFESTAVLYTPQGKKTVKTTFVKYIRSNPIFPPYYAPKDTKPFGTKISYVGPMADGHSKNGYDIHDRYETQEVYDVMSR